jgi:hypothetical protein
MVSIRTPLVTVTATVLAAAHAARVAADPATTGSEGFRAAIEGHDARARDPDHAGIWKAVTPPGSMRGEFAGDDPLGLAAGVRIPADCSINWVDPDTGRRYCFSSATSLVVFLEAPQSYLRRASKYWDAAGG